MASPVARVKREKVAEFMNCPLCNELLKEPTTISLCLHTFCRKCIYEKLSDGGVNACPVCEIKLGFVPPDKLRLEHNLQFIGGNIFPLKRRKIEACEVSPFAKMKKERSYSSLVISTTTASMQVAPSLSPPTEKVTTKGEILAIDWHKCSAVKKRRLEEIDLTNLIGPTKEADYYLDPNLRFHDMFAGEFNKYKLDMACCWVQKTVLPKLSKELMDHPLPELFKCIIYHFANFFAYNRASVSRRFEEIELYEHKAVDKEADHVKQCVEFEQKLAKVMFDHDAKLKEQADFYEAKLKEQAQHYEAKIKSLEDNVVEKTKELFDRNKQLEYLLEAIEKNHSVEMLNQLGEDTSAGPKETTSLLEEQVKLISKVQEESHRAGMEEGVRRVVRAVHAASPYVDWDRIHISQDTMNEDRLALHRAFAEGIIASSPPVTRDEDQGHVIIL